MYKDVIDYFRGQVRLLDQDEQMSYGLSELADGRFEISVEHVKQGHEILERVVENFSGYEFVREDTTLRAELIVSRPFKYVSITLKATDRVLNFSQKEEQARSAFMSAFMEYANGLRGSRYIRIKDTVSDENHSTLVVETRGSIVNTFMYVRDMYMDFISEMLRVKWPS